MTYNIAIDADSLVYKACYRWQQPFDIEKAYFEFCQEIGKIRSAPFAGTSPLFEYEKGDDVNILIVLSPKKSFRQDIYPDYKANRKSATIEGIRDLKLLILKRMKDWVKLVPNVEADDVVNYYAREHNYLVAAIDKDVINANPTHTYNYNKFEWNEPRSDWEIERWYLKQTLMGDSTDNIKGAEGIGPAKAEKIIKSLWSFDLDGIAEYFKDETDLMLNHWLVRMDMFNGKEIVLWQK